MSSISLGEAGLSTTSTYVETYMDYVESLPDDLQRDISQMRELDMLYQDKLREIVKWMDMYHHRKESSVRKKCLIQIQRCLVKSQEYGDEKLQHVSHMMDMVDTKSRQVEIEMESAELRNDQVHIPIGKHEIQDDEIVNQRAPEKIKRNRRRLPEKVSKEREAETSTNIQNCTETAKPAKKKKPTRKKKNKENNSPTHDVPIDPNEPTYCLCNQVSYGEMIGCDNDGCEIEWFHFQCVNLTSKPKGKWYCPKCSQERKQKKTEKAERNDREKNDK